MIDAHHHLWQIGRNGHDWPGPDLPDIYRDFLAEDYASAASDVEGTVLVQSQASEVDTLWLLQQAAAMPVVRAVVGWTDMAAPDAAERIAWLAAQPKLRGLRPMLQGLFEDDWILRPELEPALDAMLAHGLTFDALVFTRHLPPIAELARRWPRLKIVIDHGAKPPIARAQSHPAEVARWREEIDAVAALANIACKLSGLITEAAPGAPFEAVRPFADHLLDAFGPMRLMWGSDWPVLNLRASWQAWRHWTHDWLSDKPDATRTAIFRGAARQFYAL
ncbi:amidohydrolase family protein [Asticcacaulis sp. EMRT-3]|uniref:amidohydrolase family protein n=1 Tax=Asticcacaulis sp. EMRT-3 TaxID=3040349 RepID=UPI0024AF89E2|nr:amidohydrolase family protein [Asticcacaulis sp. EMRT-3]MDI7775294.1 amidohydrolase family protein [Asticcacaulis sp. EMRT-3]